MTRFEIMSLVFWCACARAPFERDDMFCAKQTIGQLTQPVATAQCGFQTDFCRGFNGHTSDGIDGTDG